MNYRFCLFALWLIVLVSCNHANKKIAQDVKRMMSEPINLCESQLTHYKYGIEMKNPPKRKSMYTQVVFVDSTTCSPCFWKQMPCWQSIIDSVKQHHVDLSFHFVFHVKHRNKKAFIEAMQHDTLFRYPVCLDTAGVFLRQNPIISRNKLLHSFLVDNDNHVVLVGNPMQNSRIREMFNNILLNNLKHQEEGGLPIISGNPNLADGTKEKIN